MKNIVVRNIHKEYKDVAVLDDFSCEFEYGKCTAIMGRSGCGKTSLLKILMGIDKDYTGTVEGMSERFSAVFQEDRLCEDFSVRDNLLMVNENACDGRDVDASKKKSSEVDGSKTDDGSNGEVSINEILDELGISDIAGKKVKDLSGGQKRRVAIARALVYDSELLIMDEPFKGLDEKTRECVARAVSKRKKTIIMVTHDLQETELMRANTIIKWTS